MQKVTIDPSILSDGSANQRTTEASSACLAPGIWPDIVIVSDVFYFSKQAISDRSEQFQGVVYEAKDGRQIHIFND